MKKPTLKNEIKAKIEGVQIVENNIADAKEYALEMKEYYSNLVFTDEQIKEAKEERASVNKIVKKISEYRQDIVAKFNKPLDDFVKTAKETEKLLKEASSYIDLQVKKHEESEKEKKKKECEDIFENLIGDLKDLITFDKVFNQKWLNKGTKMTEVESDIKTVIIKVESGLKAIAELDSEFKDEVMFEFLKDYDLSKAILKNTQLKEQKEVLEKTKIAKNETKKEQIKKMIEEPIKDQEDEPIKEYLLRLRARYSKLIELRKFMDINEIMYERVKENENSN